MSQEKITLEVPLVKYDCPEVTNPCAMCYLFDNASNCKFIKMGDQTAFELCNRDSYFMLDYSKLRDRYSKQGVS